MNFVSSSLKLFGEKFGLIAGALIIGWTALIVTFNYSPIGDTVEYQIAHRLEFRARELLGLEPKIHPRLKIFGYDDQAVSKTTEPDLPLRDWIGIIDLIAANKPEGIFIDQMFGYIKAHEKNLIDEFSDSVKKAGNINVGAFVHKYQIPLRPQININRKDFRLSSMTNDSVQDTAWLPTVSSFVYGPHKSLERSFNKIGHILYHGHGQFDPMIKISQNYVIPHLTFFAAKERVIKDGKIFLDQQPVTLNRNNRLHVNFPSYDNLFRNSYSMYSLIQRSRRNQTKDPSAQKLALKNINPGDIVLLLPLLYTGNRDVMDTPIGQIPGGFILASTINSYLQNKWLTPVSGTEYYIFLFIVIATLLGLTLNPYTFWPSIIGTGMVILIGGFAAFCYYDMIFPWLYSLTGLVFAGLSAHAIKMRSWVRETGKLKSALKGALPEAKIKELISGKGKLQTEASERIVTLMFIDIANFSIIAEQHPPKEVFLHLKEVLGEITKVIHRFSGTVDKTLGDGMLCFFGYSYDGSVSENQADQAIECAIELQKQNLDRCINAAKSGNPVLPLRIGLNTASCYIGDLGNEERIDFTVIGNGVNYAQRLESACEHHSVMLSATTVDFSSRYQSKDKGFKKRYINIKHYDELIETIELDPFHDMPRKREEALEVFRKSLKLERKQQRWPVENPNLITIKTELGDAALVDFSHSGLCISMKSYMSKGVTFAINLHTDDKEFTASLNKMGIHTIKTEVRWGRPAESGGHTHGIQFLNLSEDQLDHLLEQLRILIRKDHERQVS